MFRKIIELFHKHNYRYYKSSGITRFRVCQVCGRTEALPSFSDRWMLRNDICKDNTWKELKIK